MEKIKLGIVGLGYGEWIINDIVNNEITPYFTITGACDLNQKRVDHITKTYGVKGYGSLEEMLQDDQIQAIGLFTAPLGRAKMIEQIIDAKKDVITTKPFELDAIAAEKILQKARLMGRKIMLNSPSPLLSPNLAQITDWVETYKLGRIVGSRCDIWASYREVEDGLWYDEKHLCPVAPIFRLGIYLINDLVRLFGEAKTVQVLHSRIFTKRPTPDNAQMGILFENGGIANVFASFCIEDGQYYKSSMVLNFERGTIYCNMNPMTYDQVKLETAFSIVTLGVDEKQVVKKTTVPGSTVEYDWKAFYDILTGVIEIPVETDQNIVNAIGIINAMARSDESGKNELVNKKNLNGGI